MRISDWSSDVCSSDLGYYDEEGYFFIVDRLTRMINASGYKVWPTEIEGMMYAHPGIREVCIIATPDAHRGETVKAVIVPKPDAKDMTSEAIQSRPEEHTYELQSLMRNSYDAFCLKKK